VSSPLDGAVVVGWKRVRLLIHPDAPFELRFAGPVEAEHPYRVDDVFTCRRGHRRVEPGCSCGFYAVTDPAGLRPSVVRTALAEVELHGRVVRHARCLRAERQTIRTLTVDGWCAFCVRPAIGLAAVPSPRADLPAPWQRAEPVCTQDAKLFTVVLDEVAVAARVEATLRWDRGGESPAAASLRRLTRARRGAAW
jgi:hypothetical protein